MLSGMVIPGDAVEEEDEESTEGVSSDGFWTPSPDEDVFRPLTTHPLNGGKTRKKRKIRDPFYKGTDKLHLLLAEFLPGNTTVRNELIYVLDALLRLKQLTRREYTEINNRLTSVRLYTDVLQLEDMLMGDLEL